MLFIIRKTSFRTMNLNMLIIILMILDSIQSKEFSKLGFLGWIQTNIIEITHTFVDAVVEQWRVPCLKRYTCSPWLCRKGESGSTASWRLDVSLLLHIYFYHNIWFISNKDVYGTYFWISGEFIWTLHKKVAAKYSDTIPPF